jgi:serine/threonine protein kinase
MSLPTDTKRKIFDGRYEIISIVGRGADSVVYHARHITGPASEVAIKVLVNRGGSSTLTDKLRKEALTLVSCRHKYVVRLDDFHSIKDLCYLSMEYAPFGDLSRYISGIGNKLPANQAATFLQQSLEALDFIHATGVIHRDLKPENILVVNEGQIRLADFGLALLPGDELSVEELRTGVGTFDYLAPEVLDGTRYDTQSDLYSLGVCFYEAVAGSHPFHNAPLAEQRTVRLDKNINPLEELAPGIPAHVAAVINTLMRFSAENRFASAADALKALSNPEFRATTASAAPDRQPERGSISAPVTTKESNSQPIVGNAAVIFDPPASVAQPTAVIDIHKPANTDVVAPRQVQPTEKIDLERVKAIISKDTQRKSATIERASTTINAQTPLERDATPPKSPTAELTKKPKPGPSPAFSSSQSLLGSVWGSLISLPTVIRSVAIAFLSALLTIGVLLAWHTFTKERTPSKTVVATSIKPAERREDSPSTPQDETEQYAGPLSEMPEGIYTGVLQGIIPGRDVPLALISRPDGGGIVLALGLEGWVPTQALVSEEAGQENTLTFRSNGLILRFNQELSSAQITGTVMDVVTGETGTWRVAKSS